MKDKNILIMCESDPNRAPRPGRMIKYLKKKNQVSVAALAPVKDNEVQFFPIRRRRRSTLGRFKALLELKLKRFDDFLWTDDVVQIVKTLKKRSFDLIIAHDIQLLPLVLTIKEKAKILFDAKEYYPMIFEDQLVWRFVYQGLNVDLCRRFLGKCDKVITVSEGLSRQYENEFGISAEVVKSLPRFYDIKPSNIDNGGISLIHHGVACPSRRIEVMMQMMDHVDDRFMLDLMLVPGKKRNFEFLKKAADKRPNVRIIQPVVYENIIPFTNAYDIGLFLCPPTNFNLKHTLPNKFFEFIQARLAVAIGPSVEMKPIVEQYACGIVSNDFKPKSLARRLNALSNNQINQYKEKSHQAAYELNSKITDRRIGEIITELLES